MVALSVPAPVVLKFSGVFEISKDEFRFLRGSVLEKVEFNRILESPNIVIS
jgi:hypothetical protein